MRRNKMAALLAAVMMGLTSCPSAPAYAMAEETTETPANVSVIIRFIEDDTEEETGYEKGTVRTEGCNLNVRTGAGVDYGVFTQLADGADVKVVGEENGWYEVEIPARYGYVWGEYLDIVKLQPKASETEQETTFEISWDELLPLLELFSGTGNEKPDLSTQDGGLTPPGNLTLVDDYGQKTGEGRQFVTMTTKNGNYFYLVIDRNDQDEENVHFLNQVDERDLLSLLEEDEAAIYEKQQEAAKKAAEEAIKEAEERARREAAQALAEQTVPEENNQNVGFLATLLGLVILAGGSVILLWNRKKDSAGKKDPDPDEDDFAREMEEDMDGDLSDEMM